MATTKTQKALKQDAADEAAAVDEHPSKPLRDGIAEAELAWMKPLGGFGAAAIDCWADMIEESASFVATRIRHDVRALHAVLHCRTPADLQVIQTRFLQQTIDDYQTGAGRMVELAEKSARSLTAGASDVG